MKIHTFFLMVLFSLESLASAAQKALPVKVDNLLAKVPTLQNCSASYAMCTTTVDASSGLVSVKDAGRVFNELQDTMMSYMKELSSSSMSTYGNYGGSAPSKEQIAQMTQNAMQMQNMTPEQAMQMSQHKQAAPPPANNASLMQEFGKAQNAASQLHIITNELVNKATQLSGEYQQKLQALPPVKNTCTEYKVQGADLALPRCSCVKPLYLNYYQKRVAIENEYLQKQNQLLQEYLPKIRNQIVIIDTIEKNLDYGDAVSIPVVKRQIVNVQQQAIDALIPIVGLVSGAVKDSGTEYAAVANINNGHLPTPCQ